MFGHRHSFFDGHIAIQGFEAEVFSALAQAHNGVLGEFILGAVAGTLLVLSYLYW